MTRLRWLAAAVALLLGIACGRLGSPVRVSTARAAQPPPSETPASEVQAAPSPVDEDAEETKK
jgi:hypothetical protein